MRGPEEAADLFVKKRTYCIEKFDTWIRREFNGEIIKWKDATGS
jgi:hypothetical protein